MDIKFLCIIGKCRFQSRRFRSFRRKRLRISTLFPCQHCLRRKFIFDLMSIDPRRRIRAIQRRTTGPVSAPNRPAGPASTGQEKLPCGGTDNIPPHGGTSLLETAYSVNGPHRIARTEGVEDLSGYESSSNEGLIMNSCFLAKPHSDMASTLFSIGVRKFSSRLISA